MPSESKHETDHRPDLGTGPGERTLSRRQVVRGLAAAPLALAAGTALAGAAGASPRPGGSTLAVRAADKVKISFWTHTHPPMIAQNKKLEQEAHC